MSKPDGERIATIEATMTAFEKNQQALDHKVDAGFISVNAKLDALDMKMTALHADSDMRFVQQNEFRNFREEVSSQLGKRWINNTLAAILGSVLTGLVGAVSYFVTQR